MLYEKYTTSEKVSKEADFLKSLKAEDLEKIEKETKLEKDKTIISNDTFAQAEMLELLINTLRNR